MKRFFCSVLVLTLSAALLTGCGGNGGDNTKGSGGRTGSNSDSVENNGSGAGEDSVVLKYYFLTASGATSDLPLIEEKLNEYIEPIIGATVDMTLINVGSYADQVGLMVRTGEPVDLVFGFQTEMLSYVSQGAVMPLDDLLAEYGQGIIDAVGQDVLDSCKQQGVLYSIPTLKDMAAGRVFIYNQEVADELGLDFSNVKSEKDLTEIFEIVNES